MQIQWQNIPTDLVSWLFSVCLAGLLFRLAPTIFRNIATHGASRTWRMMQRRWYFYYPSYWEEVAGVKGAVLNVKGVFPLYLHVSVDRINQDKVYKMRTYKRGWVRASGENVSIHVSSDDPAADLSMLFRVPPTSIRRGLLIGTWCSITVHGESSAGPCIISTDQVEPQRVTELLAALPNIMIKEPNFRVSEWHDSEDT